MSTDTAAVTDTPSPATAVGDAGATTAATTAPSAERSVEQIWLDNAREFVLRAHGHRVHITRYDNHRGLIENGKWVACFWLSSLNPHYARFADGEWGIEYKNASTFDTYQQAYSAARKAVRNMVATGGWPDKSEATQPAAANSSVV